MSKQFWITARREAPHDHTNPHFIDGRRSNLASTRTADVLNPSTGNVQAQVLLASAADGHRGGPAVAAQKEWAAWNPQRRSRS